MGDVTLADRELDVMNVLWERGSGTVAEVQDALEDELAYTTVLTVLRTLEEKGHVTRRPEGRAHRYTPAVERQEVRESALDRMLDRLFGGSHEVLMAHLVDDEELTSDDLARIRRLLDERLEGRGETGPSGSTGPAPEDRNEPGTGGRDRDGGTS